VQETLSFTLLSFFLGFPFLLPLFFWKGGGRRKETTKKNKKQKSEKTKKHNIMGLTT
jgi:hypothetical protein